MIEVSKLRRTLEDLVVSSMEAMGCGDLEKARLLHAKISELSAFLRETEESAPILFLPYDL